MKTSKVLWWGLADALAVAAYACIVAWMLPRAGKLFEVQSTLLGPAMFLLLFVVSAAIVGALVFGRPVLLYLAGEKKEAIATFLATVTALLLIFFFALLLQIA
ncbi:MAG: hypothetical protein V1656_02180 [Candidatus Jorgensenbacteria bacterium]